MKKFTTIKLVLLALVAGIVLSTSAHAGFLYTLRESNGSSVYGYSVNETTGALTAVPGGSILVGGNGDTTTVSRRLTIDRFNGRLYVVNNGSNTISAFSINQTTGVLTALPFSPFALPAGTWLTIAVHPTGSPLIIGNSADESASYNITAMTATAAAGSPFFTSEISVTSVFSRDGQYFYTGGGGNNVAGLSVNPATGVLTPLAGSPYFAGTTALGYATDAQGRLFLSNFNSNQVRAFRTTAGVPTAATGNPFTSGLTEAIDGAVHPNGNFLAVADRSGNRVGSYSIANAGTATTLTAVAGSPFASGGTFTNALAFNNLGNFLFALNSTTHNITTYDFNATTGVLTFNNVQPINTNGFQGNLTGIGYYDAAPTAASVSVSGKLSIGKGSGLANALVNLTDQNGTTRTVRTSSFGYFRFDDVEVGQTYTVTIRSRRYFFSPQIVTVNEEIVNLNFTAN